MNWIARHPRRLAISLVAFIGAMSAALAGFFGGRVLQHHADHGGGSDWGYLDETLSIATSLCLLALIFGAVFLGLVWWKGRHDR